MGHFQKLLTEGNQNLSEITSNTNVSLSLVSPDIDEQIDESISDTNFLRIALKFFAVLIIIIVIKLMFFREKTDRYYKRRR